MSTPTENEMSIRLFIIKLKKFWRYLLSKFLYIFLAAFLFAVGGILYAWFQKPAYIAELTFAAENDGDSKLGSYAGLAAQFGFDISGGGSGSVFAGDNLTEFLKSRLMVRQTLLTPIVHNGKKELLIDYLVRETDMNKGWDKKPETRNIAFVENMAPGNRVNDSILMKITDDIIKSSLEVEKLDKNLSIISARMKSENEVFSKAFIEQLTNNAIQYFINYKSKKSRQNVAILQRQTDSVRNLLTGNIVSVASATDLNVNPIKQIVRANTQRRQVDVQVNGQVYGELLKQLEFAKITLRKETPLIQIIDTPVLPLKKKKMGRLWAGILFGFLGGFSMTLYFIFKKLLSV